jgi:Lrp/AsnC family leucine-responsive transcriptional regulator
MTTPLDDIDRKILDLLQRDARLTNAAIGAAVGLTAPSVFERIRKLEARGVIRGYTAQVDPAALGKSLTAFIRLTAGYDEKHDPGMLAISRDPDVLEIYNVAGEDCFLIKTVVASPDQLQALINRIRTQITVLRSVTMIVMTALKEDGPLNILDKPIGAPQNGHAPLAAPVRRKRAAADSR